MVRYLTPLEIPQEIFERLSFEAQIELLFQQLNQILREEKEEEEARMKVVAEEKKKKEDEDKNNPPGHAATAA